MLGTVGAWPHDRIHPMAIITHQWAILLPLSPTVQCCTTSTSASCIFCPFGMKALSFSFPIRFIGAPMPMSSETVRCEFVPNIHRYYTYALCSPPQSNQSKTVTTTPSPSWEVGSPKGSCSPISFPWPKYAKLANMLNSPLNSRTLPGGINFLPNKPSCPPEVGPWSGKAEGGICFNHFTRQYFPHLIP